MASEEFLLGGKISQISDSYQYLATSTGNLIVMCSGMHSSWPSPTLPQLLNESSTIPLTNSEGSWLAVMPCLGAPIGAILSALLVDRIGRKGCSLLCSPLYLTAWLSIAFSRSLWILIVARFIVGIADGIVFTVFPMYVAEISHYSIRGRLVASITAAFTLGSLLINCLGIYCTIQTTALVAAILPVLHFVTFCWMPESPVYFHITDIQSRNYPTLRRSSAAHILHEDLVRRNIYDSPKWKLWELFIEKGTRRALGISIGLRIVQQFSGNFVILFYCLLIFNEADGAISGSSATIIYFSIQLVSSTLSSLLVDKTGRRILLVVSIAGSGITLAMQGAYFYLKNETGVDITKLGFLPLTALILYNVLFNFGLNFIPTLVLSELFPTRVKGVALCVCDISFATAVFVATKFFQISTDMFGMHVPFLAFAFCCVAGLVFVVIYLPETKGKTLEQIQTELHY